MLHHTLSMSQLKQRSVFHLKDSNYWNNVASSASTRQTAHLWAWSKSRLHSPAYIWGVVSHQIVCFSASLFVNARCHFDDAKGDNVSKCRTKPGDWEKMRINPKVRQRSATEGGLFSQWDGEATNFTTRFISYSLLMGVSDICLSGCYASESGSSPPPNGQLGYWATLNPPSSVRSSNSWPELLCHLVDLGWEQCVVLFCNTIWITDEESIGELRQKYKIPP